MLDGRVEDAEPAGKVLLDRELGLELGLQLELLGVVALLLALRHERPERAALEAVDPVDRLLCAVELEGRGEQLDDADLSPSDGIVPPDDLSLDEARELFEGEGLIPDLPAV